MVTVGVRMLRSHLSSVLDRVDSGERFLITERRRPIALITPAPADGLDEPLQEMMRQGEAEWSGGKPQGAKHPPRIAGPSVSDAVIEDRV